MENGDYKNIDITYSFDRIMLWNWIIVLNVLFTCCTWNDMVFRQIDDRSIQIFAKNNS